MMISSKGRYALRVMIDLAEHYTGELIPMKDVAERQNISLKYIERILPALKQNGLIDAIHGKGGGYRLNRAPEEYTVGEILRLTEGELTPVSCLEKNAKPCEFAPRCKTLPMWKDFYKKINDYFDNITLPDLMQNGESGDYVI